MTLLEVLVALAVFGLLLAALVSMLHLTYGVSAARMRVSDARAEATPALDFLDALIGDARPVARVPGGPVLFEGQPDGLAFVAPLGGGFADAGVKLIRLSFADGALRIAWSPYGDFALPVLPTSGARVLLPGPSDIRFRYFGSLPAGRAAAWHDTWDAMPVLPSLVDITFIQAGSSAHSELIVALPVTGIGSSNQR